MRRLLGTIVVLSAFALAACSSPSEEPVDAGRETPATQVSEPAPTPATEPEPAPSETVSLESIAETAGIAGFERSADAAPAVLAWGKGTLDGTEVRVYEFADDAGYQAFLQSVAGYGITEEQLVHVGNFAVAPNDADQLEQIRSALQ